MTQKEDETTGHSQVVTVRQRLEDIFHEPLSCHPSKEDGIKHEKALRFLADQIDRLHRIRIKNTRP